MGELVGYFCQETAAQGATLVTVPQTDTGRRAEYAQALELTLAKELGKLTPYLR